MHISEIVKAALVFILGLKSHADELARTIDVQTTTIADLHEQLVANAATTADLEAAKAAALAHDEASTAAAADLQAKLDALDAQGAELAGAITDHPEIPLAVAPDLTVADTVKAPEPAPAAPVAEAPAVDTTPPPADTNLPTPEPARSPEPVGIPPAPDNGLPSTDSAPPIVVGG